MNWISVEDRLPEHGQQVLVYTPDTNLYNTRGEPVHIWRIDFVRGRVPGPHDWIRSEDQHGNNKRPFGWKCENGGHLWGQEVSHWMPLPEPPTAGLALARKIDPEERCSHGFPRADWLSPDNLGGCGFLHASDHKAWHEMEANIERVWDATARQVAAALDMEIRRRLGISTLAGSSENPPKTEKIEE